jgi:hypothetical protein
MNQILTALSPGGSSPAGSPCSALPVELGIAGYRGFVYMSAAFRGVRLDSRGGVHLVDGITRPVFGCKPKSRILQSSVQRALLPHACHKHSNAGEQRERENSSRMFLVWRTSISLSRCRRLHVHVGSSRSTIYVLANEESNTLAQPRSVMHVDM